MRISATNGAADVATSKVARIMTSSGAVAHEQVASPAEAGLDGSGSKTMCSSPRYGFVVLSRLACALPHAEQVSHYILLSDKELADLQGFSISEFGGQADDRILPRPLIGTIIDDDFIRAYPKAVGRLDQLLPEIDGTTSIYNLSKGADGLLDWQLSRAFGLSGRFLEELSTGQLEIARLQQIAHDHFEALQEVQRFVELASPPKPRLCVFLPPGGEVVHLAKLPESEVLTQNSKREFRAVHAFELHVAELAADSDARLAVTLSTAHSGRTLGTWTLPVSSFEKGWNRFDAPFMPHPLDEPVVIELRGLSDARPEITFSLGEITADPRLGYRRSDGAIDERSLALRIYNGVPGLRLPFRGWGRLADGEAAFEHSDMIVIDECLERAVYHGGLSEPRPELLRYDPERNALLVHPFGNGPHVAVIRDLRVADVDGVVADFTLDHEGAAATEFGLFAAPSEAARPAVGAAPRSNLPKWLRMANARRKAADATSGDSFSGQATWLRLNAGESGQIVFEAPEGLGGRFDLYLATRQSGSGTHYAWAHFVHLALIRRKRVA